MGWRGERVMRGLTAPMRVSMQPKPQNAFCAEPIKTLRRGRERQPLDPLGALTRSTVLKVILSLSKDELVEWASGQPIPNPLFGAATKQMAPRLMQTDYVLPGEAVVLYGGARRPWRALISAIEKPAGPSTGSGPGRRVPPWSAEVFWPKWAAAAWRGSRKRRLRDF